MEYSIIAGMLIIGIVVLYLAWNIKKKEIEKIKEIGASQRLNQITNQLPSNKEVAQSILKMLENEEVVVEEQERKEASLYLVLSNKILIGNVQHTFTRIQTIAHECIHSIQNKRTLYFHYFLANIYLIYFVLICILTIAGMISKPMIPAIFLFILGVVFYVIRSFLETEAMIKAKYVAKEYMESTNQLTKEEIQEVVKNYEIINDAGIKFTNFIMIAKCMARVIAYCFISLLFVS